MADNADKDERVMAVVSIALRRSAAEREPYLRLACERDESLYREAVELVKRQERLGSFMEHPLVHDQPRPFGVGEVISSRFEILREIGEGGMGFVYEAFDRKRNQRIAIKAAKPGFHRLLSPELQGALQVRHRNVCLVNEIHTTQTAHGEIDFLTMELLEGETLSARLKAVSRLSHDEAFDVASQICSGLAAAHESGVIHRDLKPGNIMLCRTANSLRVVIMDFGLAGAVAFDSSEGGTPGYMAPELTKGEKASRASDMYALGVILYETVTGRLPTEEGSLDPGEPGHFAPPSSFNEGLNPRWDVVILSCLASSPALRPSTAGKVIATFEKKPLRKAPFVVAALLIVAALVTADMLRNTGGSLNPAAYEHYLTALGYTQRFDKQGNLDLAADSLKKAIQTDPGFALGYAQLGEVYRLKYIVEQNPHWLDEAQAYGQKAAELNNRIPAVFVTLAQIHDALGKHDLALQEFQHALQLDPQDADALGGLARAYEASGRAADAEKTYQEAIALRPEDWTGYNKLGVFYDRQGRYSQAVAMHQQALQLTPDNAEVYSNLGSAYVNEGGEKNLPLAEAALKKSIAVSPGYPAYANLGLLYMQEKRYQEAAAATEQALKINGNDYMVWNNLMLAYQGTREDDKAAAARRRAIGLAEKVVQLKPRDALAQSTLATLYAGEKQNDKALMRIRTAIALSPDDPNVLSNVGEAYEFMGDREKALQYIGKSMRKGYALENFVNEPSLQELVADPRFKAAGK